MKTMFLSSIALIAALFSINAYSKCRIQWVDHDYNSMTPAIQKQICDSTLDLPAINNPGIRPIQNNRLKPLEPLSLPPLGTSQCSTQQVYENGRWVSKQICR
tara:strand:- start:1219 stop:1524 length:306 start_codon:yes stop_codon:yes gene_type:complete